MAVMTTELPRTTTSPSSRGPLLAFVVAVLSTVPFAVGYLLPYYANGLQHRPPGVTLYAYDLTTLWPYDTQLGGVVAVLAVVGSPLGPVVAAGVVMCAGIMLWARRGAQPLRDVVLLVLAIAVSIGSIAFLATPLAIDLMAWVLD